MKFTRRSNITATATWWACVTCLVASTSHADPAPAVAIALEGEWPEELAVEVKKDLGASLNERGVVVLAEGDPSARATLRISPPSAGVPVVEVEVVNPTLEVAAARELSLAREHPDTWSVAIAATADELLAATWSLPDVAPGSQPNANAAAQTTASPPTPPTKPAAAPARPKPAASPPVSTPFVRHGELGLGVALEQFIPNAQLYGGDVFGVWAMSERFQLEFGGWFRDVAPRDTSSGEIYGTVVGSDVTLAANVTRGKWLGLDVLTGVHAGIVWFDARADEGVSSRSVTGALVTTRLGGRASLFTTERTRLGVTLIAGVPLVRAAASDTGDEVLQMKGVELGARVEVGWQF